MHYTQIASVSQRLGIVPASISSLHISMSSLLSADIRTNPDSPFVKERPGVYALSSQPSAGLSRIETRDADLSARLDELHIRTGISKQRELFNKALYLTGRTLDVAGKQGVIHYGTRDLRENIEVVLPELVKDFSAHADELATSMVYESSETLRRAKQTASRLSLEDVSLTLALSVFLLELAIDLVGCDTVLVIASANSSIKVAVRSET